jgi:hypothetical protein
MKNPNGLRPSRAQGVSPVFRAALVQTALAGALRVGDTPLLALATPAVHHVAFGIWKMPSLTKQAHESLTYTMETPLNTATTTHPLVQLVSQLSQQSAVVNAVLQKQIAALVPGDPDDREELEILRVLFAQNNEKIQAFLEDQAATVEDLLEIGVVALRVA